VVLSDLHGLSGWLLLGNAVKGAPFFHEIEAIDPHYLTARE